MSLSETAKERLTDLLELQPTKNSELQDRWDMESGSEVHGYLEDELADYYYRDEDSLIRATPAAVDLVGDGDAEPSAVTVSALEDAVLVVLAGPDEDGQSVVSVLHDLRDAGQDPEVDDVRSALRGLADKGVVEVVQTTVPTFRLAVARSELSVDTSSE